MKKMTISSHTFDQPITEEGIWIWWLGQAGFLVRSKDLSLMIDPYLSDSLAQKYEGREFPHQRMMPVPVNPEEMEDVDFLLCSHGHTDHMDPITLRDVAAASPRCQFVVPASQSKLAEERGVPVDRMITINAAETQSPGEWLTVSALPSAHEERDQDDAGNEIFLGYIIHLSGVTLYHSGDSAPYDGLEDLLEQHAIDLALLPVNGRDAYRRERGILGNFTVEEALTLCKNLTIPRLIPHHFGMFDFNTIPVEKIKESAAVYPEIDCHIPETGCAIHIE